MEDSPNKRYSIRWMEERVDLITVFGKDDTKLCDFTSKLNISFL